MMGCVLLQKSFHANQSRKGFFFQVQVCNGVPTFSIPDPLLLLHGLFAVIMPMYYFYKFDVKRICSAKDIIERSSERIPIDRQGTRKLSLLNASMLTWIQVRYLF